MGAERQTPAVIIRTADYKDNDKMLTLLTKRYGRMSANARGAKKQTSKLFSAAALFCCGDYAFYEKDGRYGLKGCVIQRTFAGLQGDYDAFSAACFIADAVDKVAQEDNVSPGLFSLTVHALYALDTAAAPPRTVLCYFLQRLLHVEGVHPCLSACVVCGSASPLRGFSPGLGGAVCAGCLPDGGTRIDDKFIAAMRRMGRTAPGDIGALALGEQMEDRLCAVLVDYLEHVLQRPLKTARFVTGGK